MASAVLLFLLFGSGLITKLQSAAVISSELMKQFVR